MYQFKFSKDIDYRIEKAIFEIYTKKFIAITNTEIIIENISISKNGLTIKNFIEILDKENIEYDILDTTILNLPLDVILEYCNIIFEAAQYSPITLDDKFYRVNDIIYEYSVLGDGAIFNKKFFSGKTKSLIIKTVERFTLMKKIDKYIGYNTWYME